MAKKQPMKLPRGTVKRCRQFFGGCQGTGFLRDTRTGERSIKHARCGGTGWVKK